MSWMRHSFPHLSIKEGLFHSIELKKESMMMRIYEITVNLLFFSFLSRSLVDDVQVSCYRILNSLYLLGTNKSIYVER